VTQACRFLNISRQAYYQAIKASLARQAQVTQILAYVQQKRLNHPRMGTRKLHYLLAAKGIHIGRDRLFSILRAHRYLVPPKRAYHKTTHSHHRFHRHPNLLKPGEHQVIPDGPEQVWVADITYLPVQAGNAYLSLITDSWSRKIVGHHVHDNLTTQSVIKAFTKALKHRQTVGKLIHHSDRGVQYCSAEYQALHHKYRVTCSMTDGYDCYQNALAERVNGILKQEYLLSRPKDIEQARKMVDESIKRYNEQRPHMALEYKTPDEIHQAFLS